MAHSWVLGLKVELALATKNLSCNVAISRAKLSSLALYTTKKGLFPRGWEKGRVQLCLYMTYFVIIMLPNYAQLYCQAPIFQVMFYLWRSPHYYCKIDLKV